MSLDSEIKTGALPPRAQFFAPSRKTSGALKWFIYLCQHRSQEVGREGAHYNARGGRAPHSEFRFAFLLTVALLFCAQIGRAQFPFSLGSTGTDYGKDLAVDAQGNIILAGYFTGTVDFDPGPNTTNLTSAGNVDNCLAKYDSQGKLLWAFRYGSAGVDIPHSVSVDGAGFIYVAGYFSATCDFNPAPAVNSLVSAGSRDVYVAKYSPDGAFVWVRGFGNTNDDQALDVTVDSVGNVIAVGFFSGTVDVDPGASVLSAEPDEPRRDGRLRGEI